MRPRYNNDIMYEKALYLIESGRIESLGNGVFNVVGEHGTYIVAQEPASGKLSCNCQGFLNKGRCSHAKAVELRGKLHRRPR